MHGGRWTWILAALGAAAVAEGASRPAPVLAETRPASDSLAMVAAPEGVDSLGSPTLAATTASPWVPDRPVPASRGWETAVRLPERIATLPLSGLAFLSKHTLIAVEDANWIPRVAYLIAIGPQAGVTVAPASLGDRTGLGIAVGLGPPGLRRYLTADWDGSTLEYSRTRVTARYGPARLDYAYEWRPEERFYGPGPASSDRDTSTYAAQSQQIRLGLSHRFLRGHDPRGPRLDLAAWLGPRELITRRGRERGVPSIEERFPSFEPLLDHRFEHLVYGARVALDHRRGVPRWSSGGRTSVEVERFDRPIEALALRTSHVPFTFTRWTFAAEGGLSFWRDPRTFRLALRVVDDHPDPSGTMLPSDLATLGGSHGLAGFEPGRFHDVDALVGRLTYLFPLATRLELDVHTEVGNVYGDVWRDAKLDGLEQSYGVALRPRADTFVLGALGVDWSRDTLRIRYSIGGVE